MMNRTEELQILHDELDEARERKNQLQSQWQKIQEEVQNNDNDFLSKYLPTEKLQYHYNHNNTQPTTTTPNNNHINTSHE